MCFHSIIIFACPYSFLYSTKGFISSQLWLPVLYLYVYLMIPPPHAPSKATHCRSSALQILQRKFDMFSNLGLQHNDVVRLSQVDQRFSVAQPRPGRPVWKLFTAAANIHVITVVDQWFKYHLTIFNCTELHSHVWNLLLDILVVNTFDFKEILSLIEPNMGRSFSHAS